MDARGRDREGRGEKGGNTEWEGCLDDKLVKHRLQQLVAS